MHQTEEAELLIGDLKQQLDDAVAIENYQSAAAINAQLQDLLAEDEIANMYKVGGCGLQSAAGLTSCQRRGMGICGERGDVGNADNGASACSVCQ